MAETTTIREETNDERISALAKDLNVAEVYIRALCAGKKLSTAKLRIATYEDCKAAFSALKDTRFAAFLADALTDFVGPKDLAHKHELITLLRQSDSTSKAPDKTIINKKCLEIADELEQTIETVTYSNMLVDKTDSWAIKQVISNVVKYTKVYEEALIALIDLRKIKRD